MDLDFRDLEMLEALGDGATMTAAATRLFVTQPALSQRLATLEQRLGQPLFERMRRGLRPTEAGQRLLRTARTVLAELRAAARDLERVRMGPRRTLRLTSQCSTNYQWLAPLVQRHREQHPEVDLRFVTAPGDEPLPALRADQVDVALVTKTRAGAAGVDLQPLFEDELVAVVGRHHPWASRGTVDAEELAAGHFVLYEVYDPQRAEAAPLPLPAGIVPARVSTVPMVTQMLVEQVAHDRVATVLSRWVADTYLADGDVVAVRMTRQPPVAAWFLATREGENDPAVLAFARELATQARATFAAATGRTA